VNSKGQFSIIAALLVAVILVGTVITTYATLRYSTSQEQPQVLSAIDETNLALEKVLGFTVGYYGSILQVTGDTSYAKDLTTNYLNSSLNNIADIQPEWGASFSLVSLDLSTNWFTNNSYSAGQAVIAYDLVGLGIYGMSYSASSQLDVQISNSSSPSQVCLSVTEGGNEPLINLGEQNFKFYRYSNLTWDFVTPSGELTAFSNGTYLIDIPLGIDSSSYVVQVTDTRGLMVAAASFSRITSTFMWNTTTALPEKDYVDSNTTNIGTQSNFTAQQYGPDSIYDLLTEGSSGTFMQSYYPNNYNPLGSTTFASGALADLQSDNGQYMQFHSYASAFAGATNFGQTSVGGSSAALTGYARGNRFTCTTAGPTSNISAYLSFTASSGTLGNTATGTSGDTIVDIIRGQRFMTTATVAAQSIAAYLDISDAPTLGNTAQESSSASIENTIRGSSFTASTSGTIQSISAYISRSISYGTPTINAAIYNDITHTLVAQATAQTVSSGTGWMTFTFDSPPSLTAGNSYILVVWSSSSSWYTINLYYYGYGSTNQGHYVSATYSSTFPSYASFGHNNYRYSIYCTYTQSANVKAAIYADTSPATPIATTSPVTVSTDGWATFTFPDPKPILTASTNYYLVVWAESGNMNVGLEYSSTWGGNGRYATSTYGDWPSFVTFSTNTRQYSIYCNYETTAKVQYAIYSSTGNSRLGVTDEITLTSSTADWITCPFTTKPVLSASTQYILTMMTDNNNVNFYYTSGGEHYRASATYPTWPTSITYYSNALVSIYCTVQSASEYTCQVEFTGSSDTQPWINLNWLVDSAWTTGNVSVSIQLFNYTSGNYSTSGGGFIAYTSSLTPNTDETKTNTITTGPTDFRDSSGNWKLKITGVKSTSSSFDMKIDLTQFSPAVINYALNIEENWTNVNYAYPRQDLCIKTSNLSLNEDLVVDVWDGSSWVTTINSLQNNDWNNVSVTQYIDSSTFKIRFRGSNDASDPIQDSWSIDAVLLCPQPDIDVLLESQNSTMTIEVLQNGTMRWLGQNLQLTTQEKPIPPIPVKAIHVNQTISGENQEVPFQIEDWASEYRIPLGLTNNATVFSNRQMIVFLINVNVSKVTVWWNGSDTATQTPNAYTNIYFTEDDQDNSRLTNGKLTLQFGSSFTVTSTVGSASSIANFMRINSEASTYGAGLAYVIHHGVVRDIVQQEAEWGTDMGGGGAYNCPNVYANIVLTLPAKATYYTYQLRLMFIDSTQLRNITDLCPMKLTTSIDQLQTENGTVKGIPIVANGTGSFYNFTSGTWTAHHWSQFISGSQGAGIMFTNATNQQLYVFDSMPPGTSTGALKTNNSTKTIELLPVTLRQVQFTYALDVTWHGAIATFDSSATPIYTLQGTAPTGLWLLVEYQPTITVTSEN
jgi:hypothetical protein